MKITASNLVSAIGKLSKNQAYDYIDPATKTKVIIQEITYPEGPIWIKRYNPSKGEGVNKAKPVSISTQMLWRVANAITPGMPINIDRILGASYNTRSALETLLAHTPEFYFCFPGRIESISASSEVKAGHKHLIWKPGDPHKSGVIAETTTNLVISEIPSIEAVYESITLPDASLPHEMDIEARRRHSQIQIALIIIGKQLGSRIWIAQNDRGIEYNGVKVAEMDGIIKTLKDEKLITSYDDAIRAALLIDCIWFKNHLLMPAVFEVEHSTGVTSGLTRMKNLQDNLPKFPTRWVVVAPDELRDKVITEANKKQFNSLQTKYFPYSAVEELYSLCQRRKIRGVTDEFLDSFMEDCVVN